jgi:hypothetical protein
MTNSIGSTERRRLVAMGVSSLACFGLGLLVLWSYSFRPTPATMFLMFGGFAMVACGYFLVRAVSSYDPAREELALGEEIADGEIHDLEQEKKLLLKAIKEIEFDQALGKVDDAEAASAIARYRARALAILQQLDKLVPVDYRARIEAELAKRVGGTASASDAAATKVAEAAAEAVTEAPAASAADPAGLCACGTSNDVDAVFCKKCGARLGATEANA